MNRADITPALRFSKPIDSIPWTARRVRDFMLAYPGDDVSLAEVFALGLVDVIEERDAVRAVLRAWMAFSHEQNRIIDNQRSRLDELRGRP